MTANELRERLKATDLLITVKDSRTDELFTLDCTQKRPLAYYGGAIYTAVSPENDPENIYLVYDKIQERWTFIDLSTITDVQVSDKQYGYLKG